MRNIAVVAMLMICLLGRGADRVDEQQTVKGGVKTIEMLALVKALRTKLGKDWKVAYKSNILTIESTSDLTWCFVPPSSSIDAAEKTYRKSYVVEYRIAPLLSEADYGKLRAQMAKREKELKRKVRELVKNGMPRGAKGGYRPRTEIERKMVSAYKRASSGWTTLPVYHFRNVSLFYAKPEEILHDYEMPVDDRSEKQMKDLWAAVGTVLKPYRKPQLLPE